MAQVSDGNVESVTPGTPKEQGNDMQQPKQMAQPEFGSVSAQLKSEPATGRYYNSPQGLGRGQ